MTDLLAWVERQRKMTITTLAALALCVGFGVVAWRPAALEAYRVFAEWTVYLAGLYGGANALTYWTQRTPTVKEVAK